MSTFAQRNKWHVRAAQKIREIFERRGFDVTEHGIEIREDIRNSITEDDRCSLMMRFRPDLFSIIPNCRSFLCEVKSKPFRENDRYSSTFTWEARSYLAIQEWNRGGNVAMLGVYNFNSSDAYGAWVNDLSAPDTVWVPRNRFDFSAQRQAMSELFPDATLRECQSTGAGTPFISIPLSRLTDLAVFIDSEVLGLRLNI